MRSASARHLTHVFGEVFLAQPGSSGRLMLSWTTAGGIAGGGVLIGALALAGVVQPGVHLFAAEALFVVGALVGFVHAALLGIVGRPACLGVGGAAWRIALAALLCVPALVVAWLITAGMTLSAALLTTWSLPWMLAAVASWVLGLALCFWAGVEGWRAVRRALARLAPDFGAVSALAVLAVGLLGGTLFWRPPEALGFDLRFAPYVAVLVGFGAACSLGMPLVCTLHALRRRLAPVGSDVGSEPAPSSAV
jgi:hypothetical protein